MYDWYLTKGKRDKSFPIFLLTKWKIAKRRKAGRRWRASARIRLSTAKKKNANTNTNKEFDWATKRMSALSIFSWDDFDFWMRIIYCYSNFEEETIYMSIYSIPVSLSHSAAILSSFPLFPFSSSDLEISNWGHFHSLILIRIKSIFNSVRHAHNKSPLLSQASHTKIHKIENTLSTRN